MFWRAEACIYGHLDAYGEHAGTSARVHLTRYYKVQETPKGFWVTSGPYAEMHLVLHGAQKRFAWPTQKEALESLMRRKEREIDLLHARLRDAKKKLAAARWAWMEAGGEAVEDFCEEPNMM